MHGATIKITPRYFAKKVTLFASESIHVSYGHNLNTQNLYIIDRYSVYRQKTLRSLTVDSHEHRVYRCVNTTRGKTLECQCCSRLYVGVVLHCAATG